MSRTRFFPGKITVPVQIQSLKQILRTAELRPGHAPILADIIAFEAGACRRAWSAGQQFLLVQKAVPTSIQVMDARHQAVVGMPAPEDLRDAVAIEVDGEVVGWLGLHKHVPIKSGPPAALFKRQARQFYLLGGVVIGLTAIIAFIFSRSLLKPIRQLIHGTRELARRNFRIHIDAAGGDELGQLAENFNAMARTLEQYEKMRLQWLTDISHELRTPLAVLRGEV